MELYPISFVRHAHGCANGEGRSDPRDGGLKSVADFCRENTNKNHTVSSYHTQIHHPDFQSNLHLNSGRKSPNENHIISISQASSVNYQLKYDSTSSAAYSLIGSWSHFHQETRDMWDFNSILIREFEMKTESISGLLARILHSNV